MCKNNIICRFFRTLAHRGSVSLCAPSNISTAYRRLRQRTWRPFLSSLSSTTRMNRNRPLAFVPSHPPYSLAWNSRNWSSSLRKCPTSATRSRKRLTNNCAYASPVVVRYMSVICPVHVRFYTVHLPYIYRTSAGHELEILPCYMLVPLGLYYWYFGDLYLKC